ncbi:nucleotide exchange factor GrpE [Bacillus aquiflavi]|uniref:Protein GrpE n=1 Tax=Bacillus aquiflavi TaxID=2672567 RepID=A0A6B3VXJ2_9BACI|nr:nucleotide exchange factor GrpE [Bacillus aquiflavi]MBA4535886.1 nucleotide exchange factor GrpE [Bacillus aquiflavi]NEY80261.1 nucleotide exchange factor GrpE [Bacillus aquiflavi]UAC47305.1 nucleotide exchange factor GrpE [Bacillus aquiflavi]
MMEKEQKPVNKDEEKLEDETKTSVTKETVETVLEEENSAADQASDEKEEEQQQSLEEQLNLANNKINELEQKLEESENRYLRLQADLENYRRRVKLDLEASEKYRAQSLISDILPVIDNFERALQTKTDNKEVNSILKGVEMVYKGLLEALKKEGALPIEAVGKDFDPHFHQAVMQVNEENYASNIVVEELQKGYVLKDRVLRPSMVKVNE